jgi:high affinity sulfate transporter 1
MASTSQATAGSVGGERRRLPFLDWLSGYERAWLAADLIAGLTAAAVVIPKAMAYAALAGLPVQVGLYTAFVPLVVYAVLGGSRVLSATTTATLAILTTAALGEAVPDASPHRLLVAAATLTVLVGAILVVAAILRLGFVANFISEPVLGGFKVAIGLVVIVDQAPKLLGIHVQKTGFLRDVLHLVEGARETSLPTLFVSIALAVLILGLMRWAPKVPAPLVAVAIAIAASAALHLPAMGVKTVGAIPGGLPSPVWPDFGLLSALWPGAVGIALMSFTETIAAGRAFAGSGEPRPTPNRELFATGVACAAGGFLGAMPSGGGTTQTAVNRRVGARTQLAGLVTGLAALATILVLAPALSLMPEATLATIVIIYSAELVSLKDFRAILAVRRTEFLWALTAFAGVVFLGTLKGIVVAVIVSVLSLAHQANNPAVYEVARKAGTGVFRKRSKEEPQDEALAGLLLLRTEGRIYFGNAARVLDLLAPIALFAKPKVIVLDCSAIFDIEYSALKMLAEAEVRIRGHGAELWLAGLNPDVLPIVERSPLGKTLGRDRLCFDLVDAVQRYRALSPKEAS